MSNQHQQQVQIQIWYRTSEGGRGHTTIYVAEDNKRREAESWASSNGYILTSYQ